MNRILRHTTPFNDRLINFLGNIFSTLIGNETSIKLFAYLYIILICWYGTYQLRIFVSSNILTISIILTLYILVCVSLLLMKKIFYKNGVNGKPIFGELGGPGKKLLVKVDEAHRFLEFELNESDKQFNDEFRKEHLESYKKRIKKRFFPSGEMSGIITALMKTAYNEDIDNNWNKKWDEILNTTIKTIKFKDLFGEAFVKCQLAMAYFTRSSQYAIPSMVLCNIIIVLQAFRLVNDEIEYLTFLNHIVLLGIAASAIWFLVGMHKFSSMQLSLPDEPKRKRDTIFINLNIDGGFFKILRHHEMINILTFYSFYLPVYVIAIGFPFIFLLIYDKSTFLIYSDWHIHFILGIIWANFLLIVVFYVISLLIQFYRSLLFELLVTFLAVSNKFFIKLICYGEIYIPEINAIDLLIGGISSVIIGLVLKQFKRN